MPVKLSFRETVQKKHKSLRTVMIQPRRGGDVDDQARIGNHPASATAARENTTINMRKVFTSQRIYDELHMHHQTRPVASQPSCLFSGTPPTCQTSASAKLSRLYSLSLRPRSRKEPKTTRYAQIGSSLSGNGDIPTMVPLCSDLPCKRASASGRAVGWAFFYSSGIPATSDDGEMCG